MKSKPEQMEVKEQNIPLPLKITKQNVLWRWKWRKGNWTKPPFLANGEYADNTDPQTWTSFGEAWQAYRRGGFDGIGYVFVEDDGLCGIDLDDCRDPDTEKATPEAREILMNFNSYAEVSPSRTGFKIFIQGTPKKDHHHNKRGVGVFSSDRYFTTTGWCLKGLPKTIESRQDQLDTLCKEIWPEDYQDAPKEVRREPGEVNLDDEELIQKALGAANGGKFSRLWGGSISGYASHSEADLALCCELAFWTGRDAERIGRLFRASGLMREKWNRNKYEQRTIEKALEGAGEVYTPGAGREDRNWEKALSKY